MLKHFHSDISLRLAGLQLYYFFNEPFYLDNDIRLTKLGLGFLLRLT